jgi:hypothetical protein
VVKQAPLGKSGIECGAPSGRETAMGAVLFFDQGEMLRAEALQASPDRFNGRCDLLRDRLFGGRARACLQVP